MDNAIVVHVGEGKTIIFVKVGSVLYLLQKTMNVTNKDISNYSFLTLESANKQKFIKRNLANSELARELHHILGVL